MTGYIFYMLFKIEKVKNNHYCRQEVLVHFCYKGLPSKCLRGKLNKEILFPRSRVIFPYKSDIKVTIKTVVYIRNLPKL